MAKLSLFQTLDKMNLEDIENKTSTVQVCPDLISSEEIKSGCIIKVGAPKGTTSRIGTDQVIGLLVLIDRKRYNEIVAEDKKNQEVPNG